MCFRRSRVVTWLLAYLLGIGCQAVLGQETRQPIGCSAFSPNKPLEPSHPDFYYYGIHGAEILFTIMGPGCKTVSRVKTEGTDLAVGVWADGRVGTLRGIRSGRGDFGATVFGSRGIAKSGSWEGYAPLLVQIAEFFKTGRAPVPAEETLAIYAFMEAADESKRRGGGPVSVEEVLEKARGGREIAPQKGVNQ